MMRYYFRGNEVHNKTEWKNAFCTAYNSNGDDKHWKDGRSGESLAEDFIGTHPKGEASILDVVKRFLNAKSISLEKAEIEYPSSFDQHPRPRIQDLAIWGYADNKNIFVGVEAKVDEAFGSKTIKQQREYVKSLINTEINTEADKRLDELVSIYMGGEEDANGQLRYQLLYYLAGCFCEKSSNTIIMPVIVYKSRGLAFNQYSASKGRRNKKAYSTFMEALGFTRMSHIEGNGVELAYQKRIYAHDQMKNVYSCYIVK